MDEAAAEEISPATEDAGADMPGVENSTEALAEDQNQRTTANAHEMTSEEKQSLLHKMEYLQAAVQCLTVVHAGTDIVVELLDSKITTDVTGATLATMFGVDWAESHRIGQNQLVSSFWRMLSSSSQPQPSSGV
eukprot:SAG31_NODE_308_length_17951_cov_4.779240_17_plen_134_part_00